MDLDINTVVIQCLNFSAFAAILYFFLFKPLDKAVRERRDIIKKDFDEAKAAREEAEKIQRDYEEKLKETNVVSAEIIANAVSSAENIKSNIIAEANSAADRIKKKNEAEITDLKEKTYREMNREIGDLAVSLAGKLLETSLAPSVHRSLVDTFTAKVESGDVR